MQLSSNSPDSTNSLSQPQVNQVKKHIQATWSMTIKSASGETALPKPFTVPSPKGHGVFHLVFYWDTYFTSLGLVRDGLEEQACDNAENMMYLIETLGFVPNYNAKDAFNRSQPPVAALQIELCLPFRKDLAWRQRAYLALEQEYAFWMAIRRLPCGLNHYGSHAMPKDLIGCGDERKPIIPGREDPVALLKYYANGYAVLESGWDFTPRWMDDPCLDSAAVDLNSLLFALERVQANLARELGNGREEIWRDRMEARRILMERLLWDEERGLFVDYSEASGQRSMIISAASYFPLFCGLANSEQADRSARALSVLETDFGLDTCAPGDRLQRYQWDTPNMWPPLVWAAVSGLQQSGQKERSRTLARNFVATVVRNFETTGQLWEKYNAHTGKLDVSNEYEMPPMLGWTAGAFLASCEVAGY
jgi:alpha,alpha-trehalase